jgi:tRNA(fMet)-specific endonuclease VapC
VKISLDTNVCIALLNNSSTAARERLQRHQTADVIVSSIVLFELAYGAEKSTRRERNLRALEEFLSRVRVLDFSAADASEAGKVRSHLERLGQPVGVFDTLIAGQAKARSLILATNNVREFLRIPELVVEDWLAPF